MGHNDMQRKSPRQSIAQLEQGIDPSGYGFVSWVSIAEAKDNIQSMKSYCNQFLVMPEFARFPAKEVTDYTKMLKSLSTLRFRDPRPVFEAQNPAMMIEDNVHLTPPGHAVFADFVYNEIKDWL